MPSYFTKRRLVIAFILVLVIVGGIYLFSFAKTHKKELALGSLAVFEKVSKLLPIEDDTKKEIEVANQLASEIAKSDDQTRTYLILLQNSLELRPGGGFLGQYAIIKIKNGEVVSSFVEDANLLDQRITAKITPPYPFQRMIQLKNWKFRDSNFSPDFPTNINKAEYFYRLAGGREQFDGVIAANVYVLNHVLELTGPITIPGYGEYTSENAALKLEEQVEKAYLGEDVPAELKQNRKAVMKKLATEILNRLATIKNIPKLAGFVQEEMHNKDIMLNFKDPKLQALAESVHWDGKVAADWNNDYLMLVDANMGALKSDYYVKRSLEYNVDFTGEKPVATVNYKYNHTATYGDWRTSDYHSYLRLYVPKGSTFLERHLVGSPFIHEDFNKTVFGVKVDAVMNHELITTVKYQLPDSITAENYQLLIQKQSGVGTIPVTVRVKSSKGEFTQTANLAKDIKFVFSEEEEKKK